jgi:putative PIN family toxin of toxin-antitoxin system
MKVFFDTNVIISAFITHGHASEVFEHCLSSHECYTSDFVLLELKKNLRKKFGYSETETKNALDLLIENLLIVKNYMKIVGKVCRDPDDDNILAAAISVKADCIITGDKDLKVLKNHIGINIISPKEFWSLEKAFMKMN